MTAATRKHEWSDFLRFYTQQHKGRRTRLGLFEHQPDGFTDYWLENGLPLEGVDIDTHDEKATVEIMLDGFEHPVRDVRSLKAHFSFNGDEDGLDITDSEGNTTILRFEQ